MAVMKKKRQRLSLTKETVTRLTDKNLGGVMGGALKATRIGETECQMTNTCASYCPSKCVSCILSCACPTNEPTCGVSCGICETMGL